ncbi:MAG: hypothetical protein ACKVOP_02730 [Sphingomonadaceae bacterium]
MMKLFFAIAALLSPMAAHAANDVSLTSSVFVEKTIAQPNGTTRLVLEEPRVVVPGDRLVFVLAYKNMGTKPATDFVVTNPMPGQVAFQGAADTGSVVSIDGGRNWGALPALKVRKADGAMRAALPEDVTHVRWAMKAPIPVGQTGKLSFRGIVK